MLLRKTIRFASYILVSLGFIAVEGCSKDDGDLCYRCTYTYDGDTETDTFCYEDYKGQYGIESKDDFRDAIAELEDAGYDCKKK
jgi:hypothetical protein